MEHTNDQRENKSGAEDRSAEGNVSGAHAWREVDVPLSALAHDLQSQTARITEQIAAGIQSAVSTYSGPSTGKRHWLIGMAARAAIGQLVAALEGGAINSRKVDDLFAKMGYGEATDGHEISLIISALDRAAIDIWDEVRVIAVAHDASAATLSHISEVVQSQITHLREQIRTGYSEAQRVEANASIHTRTLDALLSRSQIQLYELAAEAHWRVPQQIIVASVARTDDAVTPFAPDSSDYLSNAAPHLTVATDAVNLSDLLDRLRADPAIAHAAVSWAVPTKDAADAHRWARRALDLARQGIIPADKILDCAEHRTQLWLHSEPTLRRQLCQELLPRLLAETPNSREILSETLLVWLETRDSAPAIAARLDVHPQTVRYRWKRINELFGDALHDPETVVQLTMLLKASVPMWKAGDQSDFERFQAEVER